MQIIMHITSCPAQWHTPHTPEYSPDCSRIAQRFSYVDPVAFVDIVAFPQQEYQDSPASIPTKVFHFVIYGT